MTPEAEIANLLHVCAEDLDRGDFASAAGLFADARLRLGPDTDVNADTMLSMWRAMVIVCPDGTPRTEHVVTNPIVEVDDEVGTATCRWGNLPLAGDYYSVLQQTGDFVAGDSHRPRRAQPPPFAGAWMIG